MKESLQNIKNLLRVNLKKISKKPIAFIIAGIVFFTAVIYTLANGIDYKSLKSDISSTISSNANYSTVKFYNYSNSNFNDNGIDFNLLNDYSITFNRDTSFSVYVYGTKYEHTTNKDEVDISSSLPSDLKKNDDSGASGSIHWEEYNGIYFPKLNFNLGMPDFQNDGVVLSNDKALSNGSFGILIKNAGTTSKGNKFDVYIDLWKVEFWKRKQTVAWFDFSVLPYFCIDSDNASNYPASCTGQYIDFGNPLNFQFNMQVGATEFNIAYGTGNLVKGSNGYHFQKSISNTSSDILTFGTGILFNDIDIKNKSGSNTNKKNGFSGNEGIDFLGNDIRVFYDSTRPSTNHPSTDRDTTKADIYAKLSHTNYGLYISNDPYNVENLRKSTSAYANFYHQPRFQYSTAAGGSVNIYFSTLSPYLYHIKAPQKSVDKDKVTGNTSFNYTISQEVPSYSRIQQKLRSYLSIYEPPIYELKLSDKIDSNLTFDISKITIKRDDGDTDYAKCFDISSDSSTNTITATINRTERTSKGCKTTTTSKGEQMAFTTKNGSFYGHTWNMTIPVTTKSEINQAQINNSSTTKTTEMYNSDESLNSNTVTTNVYYNITKQYKDIDENDIPGFASTTEQVSAGSEFSAGVPEKDPVGYNFVKTTSDYNSQDPSVVSGTVTKDITIIYYYKKVATITSNYYVCNTNSAGPYTSCQTSENKIIDTVIENKEFGDAYNAETIRKTQEQANASSFANYDYWKTECSASSSVGVISSSTVDSNNNITMNYYYKRKATIKINYLNKITKKPIVTAETDSGVHYADIYNVQTKKEAKENETNSPLAKYTYDSFDIDGTTTGTLDSIEINKDTINVNLYYKQNAKLIIVYLEIIGNDVSNAQQIPGIDADNIDVFYGDVYKNVSSVKTEKEKNAIFNKYVYHGYNLDGMNNANLSNITINKDTTVVRFYYKKRATITIKYWEKNGENDTAKQIENITDSDNVFYGDSYDVTVNKSATEKNNEAFKELEYKTFTSNGSPNADLSKIGINQDEVMVNLYYSRIANINVKHLDEYTGKPVSGDANGVNIRANFGDAYSSFDIRKKDITGYDYSKTVSTPTDITGNINTKTTTITHYYKKKAQITIKYIDSYTKKEIEGVSADTDSSVHYGDTYNVTTKKIAKEKDSKFTNYTYDHFDIDSVTSGDLNGVLINKDSVVVNLYYKKKATITVNYYKEGTTEKLTDSDILNKYYGDSYDVSTDAYKHKSTIPNKYEYASVSPANKVKGTVSQDTITVNYYYKLTKAKIIINYYKEGTTEKLADSTTLNQTYDDKYDVTNYKNNKSISSDYKYVSYTSTPENALSGIVSQDIITVNYYYALKEATVNIKYLDELTGQSISNEENIQTKYGVEYSSLNLDSYKKEITGYDYSKTETTPTDITGKVNQDTTTITHYYKKKVSITINYIDMSVSPQSTIDTEIDTNIYIGGKYNVTTKKTAKEKEEKFSKYIYDHYDIDGVTTEKLDSVTINKDNVVVNLYYKKKAKITIKYIDMYTNEELHGISEDTDNTLYGVTYNVQSKKDAKESDSELLQYFIYYTYDHFDIDGVTTGDLNGVLINKDSIVVKLYYNRKSIITVNYYKEGTTEKLTDSDILNKYYGDSYDVSTDAYKHKSTIPNKYEYASVSPANKVKGTVSQDTITVNYYYKLTKAKIIINYYKEGTTEKLADSTTLNQTYDDKYDVTNYKNNKSISSDYKYVSYTSTPENALSGIVSQDTITVNYYYALKEATINIKYLDELTNENILNEENINTKYGVLYNTLNLDSYKKEIPGYNYSKTETTPRDITGKVNQDTTTIIHYYKKKASITINYIDKYTNTKIDGINSDVINSHYGDSYNTENNRTEKEKNTIFNDYDYANEYIITPENTSLNGTINTDKIVVNYYYNKKSNITIKYYDIETNKEITKENVDSKVHYGDIYNVEAKKIKTEKEEIFKNYNFERYDSNSKQKDDLKQIKIDNENVTVDLYYRLKISTITIKYLEETTNKELAETYTKSMKYTEVYNATEIRDKAGVPKNYNLVRHESSTGVLSGTISEPSVLIIFYYEKKDPKLETNVSKTGTKEITRKDAEVGYKLNYKAVIRDYIGDAKVTYIDKLPYEIDEEKSDISGGKYNKESKTIIWEETYEKIDMEKEITFTKEINVVYIGIEDTDRIMTNEIETTIKLDNKESTVTSDYDTDIKIPGEIVIHYYDKETKEKLTKDIEKTDLIGNQYVSEEKEFEGYKLVSKPESNVHIYKEKKQEFSYEYEKIKFKITTKVEGEGGTIEGDEIVKYGEDSSKDKIKIKAKEGYEINKITINGESYEITDRNEIIMPYFKEVKEDKEIIVSFVKKIENPKTLDNIMSYIGYAVLSIIGLVISGIVLIKNKTQEKI